MIPEAEITAPPIGYPAFLWRPQHVARRAIPWMRAVLMLDTLILLAALVAVLVASNSDRMPNGIDSFLSLRVTVKNVVLLAAMLIGWPALFRAMGLYDDYRLPTWPEEATRAVMACSAASCLAMAFPLTSISGMFRPIDVTWFWIAATTATLASRGGRRIAVRQQTRNPHRVIIVGGGPRGQMVYDELSRRKAPAYEMVGFVDAMPAVPPSRGTSLGALEDLESILMRQPIDEVFITLPVASKYRDIQEAIAICERAGVPVKYRTDMFDSRVAWPEYESSPVVTMQVAPNDSRLVVKRAIDLLVGSAALIVAVPLMAAIAAAIKITSRGPLLFAQERYGRNKRIFRMYKFRTMVADADRQQDSLEAHNEMDGPVFKIKNDPRVTRLGRFLRISSLDELPQLFQVISGKMSLVGPRPLPLRDVARFTRPTDMRRFSVRPGLTCLWQISGRNELGFNEWIRLDLAYIDRWSLLLDFYILVRTIPAVFRGTGAR